MSKLSSEFQGFLCIDDVPLPKMLVTLAVSVYRSHNDRDYRNWIPSTIPAANT
jgi:hypothetical protein